MVRAPTRTMSVNFFGLRYIVKFPKRPNYFTNDRWFHKKIIATNMNQMSHEENNVSMMYTRWLSGSLLYSNMWQI